MSSPTRITKSIFSQILMAPAMYQFHTIRMKFYRKDVFVYSDDRLQGHSYS